MPTPPAQLPSTFGPGAAVTRPPNRNRRAEHLVLTALAVTGVLGVAAWQIPPLLDWSRYRSAIAVYASARLGRHVTIGGQVRLTLLPRAMLMADDVTLADRGDGISARIGTLRLEIALGGLLAGQVMPRSLTIDKPVVTLPWPLPRGTAPVMRPAAGQAFSATIEDGTLLLGGIVLRTMSASFRTDPDTGAFGAQGSAMVAGLPWRFTALTGAPGGDGVSPLTLTLDGQAAYVRTKAPSMQGTGAAFHGRILRDGTVAGRLALRGPDLSRLGPAPAVSWQVSGDVAGDATNLAAPSVDMLAGASPGHAAIALRLAAPASLKISARIGTVAGGDWVWQALQLGAGPSPRLATDIDLSAGAMTLSGDTLRSVHLALSSGGNGTKLRAISAILPGGARLEAEGASNARQPFIGHAHLVAPDLRRTLHWLSRGVLDGLPPAMLRHADLRGDVTVSTARAALTVDAGRIDDSAVGGTLAVSFGARPAIGLDLTLDRIDPAGWFTPLHDRPAATTFHGVDASIRLRADTIALPGVPLHHASLDAESGRAGLTLHRFAADLPGGHVEASGTLGGDGVLADGRLDLTALDAALLPAAWRVPANLWQGNFHLAANAAGPPQDLAAQLRADLGDLRAEAEARIDTTAPRLEATVTLRHPGAPRLLSAIGVQGAETWLENGSLAVLTHLVASPGHVQAQDFSISAAALQMTGDVDADLTGPVPVVMGHVDAAQLPLPAFSGDSKTPLPWAWLHGIQADWQIRAAHVSSGLRPVADRVSARLSVAGGAASIDDLQADMAGGSITGRLAVDSTADPPAVSAMLEGRYLIPDGAGPSGFTLAGGTVDAQAEVMAHGYSPWALLAQSAGTIRGAAHAVTLNGIDLPRANAALQARGSGLRAALLSALAGGSTSPMDGGFSAGLADGVIGAPDVTLTGDTGSITMAGTVDVPHGLIDLAFSIHPSVPAPPVLGVRLAGPWILPARQTDVAAGLAWAGQGRKPAQHRPPVGRRG